MKKNVFIKSLLVLLATTIFISGSFLMSNDVYADSNIPNSFRINGVTYQSNVTSLMTDEAYQIPQWLYDSRFNDNFDDVYNDWKSAVVNGVLNSQTLHEFYETAEPNLNTAQRKILGYGVGKTIAGGGNKNTKAIIKTFLGVVGYSIIVNIVVQSILSFSNKIWEAIKKYDPTAEVTSKEYTENGLEATFDEAKNYYQSADTNNYYNKGSTIVDSIYDYSTGTINDVVNHNEHYVTNYTYDFNNNLYDYTTDDGYQYKITNSVKYVELQSLINGVTNTYRQYFKLPNGDNSYNLTEDEIHGYKLDFNVQRYTSSYDYDDLKLLYHFNGDFTNSAYNSYGVDLVNNLSNSFVYVNDIWDGAVFLNGSDLNSDYKLFNRNFVTLDNNIYLSLRFMPSMLNKFKINFYNDGQVVFSLGHLAEEEVNYISKDTTQSFTGYNAGVTNYQIFNVSVSTDTNTAIARCNGLGGSSIGTYTSNVNGSTQYNCACQIPVNNSGNSTSNNVSWKQYFAQTTRVLTPYSAWGINGAINYENWNNLSIYNNSSSGNIYLKINKFYIDVTNYFDGYFNIGFETDNYALLDEFAFFQSTNSLSKLQETHFLPFDTNQTYVVPNSLTFENNLILLKTPNVINGWQIGGKRPSSPTTNSVYFSVDENGCIDSVQQYVKGNWISIDGAIYNGLINKFVNIIGYNVFAGEEQYVELGVDEDSDLGWLSTTINEIRDVIISGFDTVNEKLDKILNPKKTEQDSILDKVNDIEQAGEFLDEEGALDIDTQLDTDVETITQLADVTDDIFDVIDDNNLQILYTAPLIVLLLRLII